MILNSKIIFPLILFLWKIIVYFVENNISQKHIKMENKKEVLAVARDQLLNVPVNVLRNGGVVVAEAGHITPNRNSGRSSGR